MNCQWDQLLSVLPMQMRREVDRLGREELLELRLRIGAPPILCCLREKRTLVRTVTQEDLAFVINTASRYSPWTANSMSKGFLTAPGGHRIGLCGQCVVQNGTLTGFREVTSLCIRVAREYPGIAAGAPERGSLLILGPPGAGKTTLLRDLIRNRSNCGQTVAVVDEREELFPAGFSRGDHTDVLSGCGKPEGIHMALCTLGPQCIAVDEITSEPDCDGMIHACWCGVELLATAHATSCKDLFRRDIYRRLVEKGLFQKALVLSADKSWHLEEVRECISSW